MEIRGYKQTATGMIPEEWESMTIGEVSTFSGGSQPPRSVFKFAPAKGYIRLIQIRDYKTDEYTSFIPESMARKRCTAKDIMIGRYGPPIFQILRGIDGAYNVALIKATPSRRVSPEFLFYVLSQRPLFELIDSLSRRSSGQTGIEMPALKAYGVALPPLPEQFTIAQALSDMDALLDALDRLIAKKRDLKQAAMQQLLTGLIRLPGFSGKWELKMLPQVCQFRGGKAHEQYIDEFGQYVCVNSKFISTDGRERKYSIANFCCARKNDILMVMSDLPNGRALAKSYLVEQDNLYAVNQRVCALTAYHDCPQFLSYILNRNPYFLKFDDGVSQTHLLNNVFLNCPIRIPQSVPEQIAIAAVLTDMDAELAVLEQRLDKSRALKQAMMEELLTGKTRLVSPQVTHA